MTGFHRFGLWHTRLLRTSVKRLPFYISMTYPSNAICKKSVQVCKYSSSASMGLSVKPKFEEQKPNQTDSAYPKSLEMSISRAAETLISQQNPDGHWRYPLECHAGISADFILSLSFVGEDVKRGLGAKIGRYIRRTQGRCGAWSLRPDGDVDVSVSVVSYLALRVLGDKTTDPHMLRARDAILKNGGAEKCNTFSRIHLALQGIIEWKSFPAMPVELMLLPTWFPINIYKFAFWARTTIVPLLVLRSLKCTPKTPLPFNIDELFIGSPTRMPEIPRAPHQSPIWHGLFRIIEKTARAFEPLIPAWIRKRAVAEALAFIKERLNGIHGYASIPPPMILLITLYDSLGYGPDHPDRAIARNAVERLVWLQEDEAYCEGSLSPLWDTILSIHALLETENSVAGEAAKKGMDWVRPLQYIDFKGDWAQARPNLAPGGWTFFYDNRHYPDTDDTSVVLLAMHMSNDDRDSLGIQRGIEWIRGMQCKNGGWGAYDADNTAHYLNNIPMADHTALMDPPTVDVTSRCLLMLSTFGHPPASDPAARKALEYILANQEPDGSWYGRWGVNYIYGTWSALEALAAAGLSTEHKAVDRAVSWLLSIQNEDGGWGEGVDSYKLDYAGHVKVESSASQTAWALIGLMSAGQVSHSGVARGIAYLIQSQNPEGQWTEHQPTGNGHPNIVYLTYHGYSKYFPLLALARYRRLSGDKS